jgi:hypothetical protein
MVRMAAPVRQGWPGRSNTEAGGWRRGRLESTGWRRRVGAGGSMEGGGWRVAGDKQVGEGGGPSTCHVFEQMHCAAHRER